MSKLIKKVFSVVKDSITKPLQFVKKHWKAIALVAAVVFTAGAASVVAAGGTWGSAVSSLGAVGSTFSAGASALTGGMIGTSASSAVGAGTFGTTAQATAQMASMQGGLAAEGVTTAGGSAAQAATASQAAQATALASNSGAVGSTIGNAVHGVLSVGGGTAGAATTTGGAVVDAGMSVGKAMLIGTGVQAAGALYQGKEQADAEKKARNNAFYYGMNGKGEYADGFDPNGASTSYQPTYQSYQQPAQDPNTVLMPRAGLLARAAYQPNRNNI